MNNHSDGSESGGTPLIQSVDDLPHIDTRAGGDQARRVLLELAIAAAGIGTFDWDVASGTLAWDERVRELFGYTESTFDETIEAFNARLHPEDVDRVSGLLAHAMDTCGEYEAEYRVQLPDGDTRWISARGRALCNESGETVRVLGAAFDTTARREGQANIARIMDSLATAFFFLDAEWKFTYVNSQAEIVLGRKAGELLNGNLWELFPAAVGSDFDTHYRNAMRTQEPVQFDAFYPAPLNAWYEVRALPAPDGLAVYFLDVTERRREQAEAEAALRRSTLLSTVTSSLIATLDASEAVNRLAQLTVPALADWCLVTLIDDEGHAGARRSLNHAGGWHAEESKRDLVTDYGRIRLDELLDDSIIVRSVHLAEPQVILTDAMESFEPLFEDGKALDLLRELNPYSVVIMPLCGRDRTVGVLTLCNGKERGAFSDIDVNMVREVADRAGLVLDNARLYRQQRGIAEDLQRSMLTDPPEPDHMQVVVRYAPAAEASQVGGDWYDAFMQPNGATVLVIGDVVGHDAQAAAAMGQIRTLMRSLGGQDDRGPAEMLSSADRVMRNLQMNITASAATARLEQSIGERDRGVTRMRWSNAGHPPPMVINPDGTVTALAELDSDLLLGVDATTDRREMEVVVDRGATVLLYTDGLVERRGQSLSEGLALLRSSLAELADLSLDDLCDQLLARLAPEGHEDDVALVAVRLHRQDQPRPEEAGPERIPDTVELDPG